MDTVQQKALQKLAGHVAETCVSDGMHVGLGTGRSVRCFLEILAQRCSKLQKSRFYVTSDDTLIACSAVGIPVTPLQMLPSRKAALDITIDGADQIDESGAMIKGGGGALLKEKILAHNSKEYCILIAKEKKVPSLSFPLPVEVPAYAGSIARAGLADLFQCDQEKIAVRNGKQILGPVRTEQNAVILDVHYDLIEDAASLARRLSQEAYVLAHGLFVERDYQYMWYEAGACKTQVVHFDSAD